MTILDGASAPFLGRRGMSTFTRLATSIAGYRIEVLLLDVVFATLACIAAPVVLGVEDPTAFPTPMLVSLMLAALLVGSIAVTGGYRLDVVTGATSLLAIVRGAVVAFAIVAIGAYIGVAVPFNARVIVSLSVAAALLVISRAVMLGVLRQLRAAGSAASNILVITPSARSGEVATAVADDPRFTVSGVVTVNGRAPLDIVHAVAGRVANSNLDAVLVEDSAALGVAGIRRLAWELEPTGTELLIGSAVTRFAQGRTSLTTVADETVVRIDHSHQSTAGQFVKRGFDIVVSMGILLVIAPVIALTALAIRIESPGPAFFVQPRVGRNGKLFPFFKLRSMRVNAHLERSDTLGPTDDGILDRYRNDTRITRVGAFIRRWSIDELPQLANVLIGHMSLVGPRPVLVEELHDLPVDGERVHLAKPGLTGLWQISGRKEIKWEDRIDLDLEYVDAWSLGMDARILSRTAGAVVKGSGAY